MTAAHALTYTRHPKTPTPVHRATHFPGRVPHTARPGHCPHGEGRILQDQVAKPTPNPAHQSSLGIWPPCPRRCRSINLKGAWEVCFSGSSLRTGWSSSQPSTEQRLSYFQVPQTEYSQAPLVLPAACYYSNLGKQCIIDGARAKDGRDVNQSHRE